jgi:hypothetical protein
MSLIGDFRIGTQTLRHVRLESVMQLEADLRSGVWCASGQRPYAGTPGWRQRTGEAGARSHSPPILRDVVRIARTSYDS